MEDVVRVRASAVATIASELAWRSKLHGGLAIGAGVLVAIWTVVTVSQDLDFVTGADRDDELAGAALFLVIAAVLAVWGFMRLRRAGRLTRAAVRAQADPTTDWIVLDREVRSTDPRGTGEAPCTFRVSRGRRTQLLRDKTS